MLNVYPYKSRRRFVTTGRPGGVNADRSFTVKTEAVGKAQWEESPYLLANEWISANIAQFLRLPVPPFAIARKKSRKTAMFISYSYDGDTKPDDVEPVPLYNAFKSACTGVVVFDIFVANCDRNGGNLKVDNPGSPKSFYLIDHERALFHIWEGEGVKRLRSLNSEERLGVTDGATSANEWHCLVELIDDINWLHEWVKRVQSVPDWFVDEICNEMWKVAINKRECDEVKGFLKTRRDEIGGLILKHKNRFPLIRQWPLFVGR
jgi:hypothetical protein